MVALQTVAFPAHWDDVVAERQSSEAKRPTVWKNSRFLSPQEQPASVGANSNYALQDPHAQQSL